MEGAKVYYEIPFLGYIPITETMINSWIVMLVIILLCLFLTSGLSKKAKGKQIIAEKIYTMLETLVIQTMGKQKLYFLPYIGTLFVFSAFSSLSSLFTLRPPTADLNTTVGWALITFTMVQYAAIKSKGPIGYVKGFAEPIAVMLPLNLIGEIANPISMSFRHFGNIAAGMVITTLLYGALASLSTMIFGGIASLAPSALSFLNTMPAIFQIGLPGLLSIYFDLFTSGLQAFIFCMLTMVFVSMAE